MRASQSNSFFWPGALQLSRALPAGGAATTGPTTGMLTPIRILILCTKDFGVHIGWMVLNQDSRRAGRVDISDLNAHKGVMFQHRNYLSIALPFGFVFPLSIGYFCWGDFWGSPVYARFSRMLFVHQATFCVSSLAHTFGQQTY